MSFRRRFSANQNAAGGKAAATFRYLLSSRLSLLVLEFHQICARALADCTANREFHPAPKTFRYFIVNLFYSCLARMSILPFLLLSFFAADAEGGARGDGRVGWPAFEKTTSLQGVAGKKSSVLPPISQGTRTE